MSVQVQTVKRNAMGDHYVVVHAESGERIVVKLVMPELQAMARTEARVKAMGEMLERLDRDLIRPEAR
jgi:hypothetical protein